MKPTLHGWSFYRLQDGAFVIHADGVSNHPRIGTSNRGIRTSVVVSVDPDKSTAKTRNTEYVLLEKSMEDNGPSIREVARALNPPKNTPLAYSFGYKVVRRDGDRMLSAVVGRPGACFGDFRPTEYVFGEPSIPQAGCGPLGVFATRVEAERFLEAEHRPGRDDDVFEIHRCMFTMSQRTRFYHEDDDEDLGMDVWNHLAAEEMILIPDEEKKQ